MATLIGEATASDPQDERLELHVRYVASDDKVTVCLDLHDGSTITLNRSCDDDMISTLRRLSLTVQKRRRISASKSGAGKGKVGAAGAEGGKTHSGKKRAKGVGNGGGRGGGGSGSGLTAGLFDRTTGEPIEIGGVLNRDGWTRLCWCEEGIATDEGGGRDGGADGDNAPSDVCPENGGGGGGGGAHNSSSGSRRRRNGPTVVRIGPPAVAATPAAAADDRGSSFSPPAAPAVLSEASAEDARATATAAAVSEGGFLEMDVIVNPPAVTSLECPVTLPMAGFSVVAQAETEFATTTGWEWLREDADDSNDFTRVVGTLAAYTPTDADVGRRIMVRCTPLGENGRKGRPVVRVLTSPVRPGCEPGSLALRRCWLDGRRRRNEKNGGGVAPGERNGRAASVAEECSAKIAGQELGRGLPLAGTATEGREARRLRVMCYNILADMYCMSEQADKVLYPHCPREYRAIDYRMQMVAREIRGHGTDLVMLQECEAKAFNRFLAPGLKFDGFDGIYLNKAGQAQEGEAIFYRTSALTLESSHDFSMKDVIPAMQEFQGLLEEFPTLSTIVRDRLTTVAQVAVFSPTSCPPSTSSRQRAKEEKNEELMKERSTPVRVIVANTHLYFHPNAAHVRLMQLVALVERIAKIRSDLTRQGFMPVVILGGDLNSPPFGPVRYLMGELIGPDCDLWSNVDTFKWGDRFFDEVSPTAEAKGSSNKVAYSSKASAEPDTDHSSRDSVGNGTFDPTVSRTTTTTTTATATPTTPKKRRFLPCVPYLRMPLELELASGTPAFTNFTPEFTETLDYVFIEGGQKVDRVVLGDRGSMPEKVAERALLSVEGERKDGVEDVAHAAPPTATPAVAPMPEEGPLRSMTPGLPSETYPSDHISLVVDLELLA